MNVKKEARKFINQTEIKEELDIAQRVWLEFHIIDLLEAHASSKMPSDDEICQVASDEAQQDWDRLEYKHIYSDGFYDGAQWAISLAKPTNKP